MKALCLLQVLNFPFPTAPDGGALAAAERALRTLGALDADGALTERGRAMARLPLDPRPSRMILQVLVITIVTTVTVLCCPVIRARRSPGGIRLTMDAGPVQVASALGQNLGKVVQRHESLPH